MGWKIETIPWTVSVGASRRLGHWALSCSASARALVSDRYHPERHYMRGRGPAWHRKYGEPLAVCEPHED